MFSSIKKTYQLKTKGIDHSFVEPSSFVLDITQVNISQEELSERFSSFEIVVTSFDDSEILTRYHNSHHSIPNISRVKDIEKLNHISFDNLFDKNKKSFSVLLIIPYSELESKNHFLSDFENINILPSNKAFSFFPLYEPFIPSDDRFLVCDEYFTSFNFDILNNVKHSLLDVFIKTHQKTSLFYYKLNYSKKGISISLILKNASSENLSKDIKNFISRAKLLNYSISENNSIKSFVSAFPFNKNPLKPFVGCGVIERIPKYLKQDYASFNTIFEDKIERLVPFNVFDNKQNNFLISSDNDLVFMKNIFYNYLLDLTSIRIIDSSGTYSSFINLLGGQEYSLSEYSSFKLFNDADYLSIDEENKVLFIILSLTDTPHSSLLIKEIRSAIKSSFLVFKGITSLKSIYKLLKKSSLPEIKTLLEGLRPYAYKGSSKYTLFNGLESFNFSSDLISFNFKYVDYSSQEALKIYIFSMINLSHKKRTISFSSKDEKSKLNLISYINSIDKEDSISFGFNGLDYFNIRSINSFIYGSNTSSDSFSYETNKLIDLLNPKIQSGYEFLIIQNKFKNIVKLDLNPSLNLLFTPNTFTQDTFSSKAKALNISIQDLFFEEAFLLSK